MAAKEEEQPQEKKIPVFTVLKNNSILKNIFLLDSPPSVAVGNGDRSKPDQEFEEMLLVGRHPDCHIILEHPSISRFHLRIHSKPSSQKLSVTDLSSVHGTWISGKKIEPDVQVELNEGDKMRLGGSSRIYRLHWVPMSQAYDLEDPYLPPLDASMSMEENEEEANQDDNCSHVHISQIQSQGSDNESLERLNVLLSNENLKSCMKKGSPSAPPISEYMSSSFSDEAVEKESPSRNENEQRENSSPWFERPPISEYMSSSFSDEAVETESPSRNENGRRENSSPWFEPPAAESIISDRQQFNEEIDNSQPVVFSGKLSQRENIESPTKRVEQDLNLLDFLKSSFSMEETGKKYSPEKGHDEGLISSTGGQVLTKDAFYLSSLSQLEHESDEENQISERETSENIIIGSESKHKLSSDLNSTLSNGGAELCEVLKRDSSVRKVHKQKEIQSICLGAAIAHSGDSSFPNGGIFRGIKSKELDSENHSPEDISATKGFQTEVNGSTPTRSGYRCNVSNIWSRRGKPASVQIQTGKNSGISTGVYIDAGVELLSEEDLENESVPKDLSGSMDEEIFTPDKENFTPTTLLLRSMKKMGRLEQNKHPGSNKSSFLKNVDKPDRYQKNTLHTDKENQTSKALRKQKSMRPTSTKREISEPELTGMQSTRDRVPFQSLLMYSTDNSNSRDPSLDYSTARSRKSVCNPENIDKEMYSLNKSIRDENRSWSMVVDTACLLNKKSRKALELLQGLKGTQLIIPRVVIRELDCMKRRGSLFRRTSEVSSALQWIEDCMVNTQWWIHVQSSAEDGRPTAPTPPASPLSRFSENNGVFPVGSVTISACESLLEIVSPTTEDHVLECALLFRKMKNDGRLVLLSNDVALKIKAMAEGLICETAEEFRETLVNPFSERFLWADSSPRGRTWNCTDDVVLREKYCCGPLKQPSNLRENVKGLKLILFHNSQYRHISSACQGNFAVG